MTGERRSSFRLSREARPSGPLWLLIKTAAQTILFWSLFLFLIPLIILRLGERYAFTSSQFSSLPAKIAGLTLFLPAAVVGLACCVVLALKGHGTPVPFDSPRRFVVAGPYRYVRNPMAASALTQGLGVALYLGCPFVVAYVVVGAVAAEAVVRPWEEGDLERRFGEEYRAYLRNVPVWIPRLTAYRGGDHAEETHR